ncbi:MAG TPA: hypothetical protein VK421_05995 [Pyrinomonadaceae bacterium]|nr:hypothetical protein [Pyrinomonadaceae bacterium]
MRVPNADGEVILFRGLLATIIASGDFHAGTVRVRVEDERGEDITHLARMGDTVQDVRRSYVVMELDRPGFDGPFCTPDWFGDARLAG